MPKTGWVPKAVRSKRLRGGSMLAVIKAADWWEGIRDISMSMPTDYVVGQYRCDGKGYGLKVTRGQCQDKADALLLFDAITSSI